MRPMPIGTSLANNERDLNHEPDVERHRRHQHSVEGAHVAWNAGTTLTLSAYHNIIFEPGS